MEMFLFDASRAIASRVSRGGARYTRRDATLPVRRGDALFGVFWRSRVERRRATGRDASGTVTDEQND